MVGAPKMPRSIAASVLLRTTSFTASVWVAAISAAPSSLMKDGKFPKALRLGVRAVGWDSAEIDQWIADRLKERA